MINPINITQNKFTSSRTKNIQKTKNEKTDLSFGEGRYGWCHSREATAPLTNMSALPWVILGVLSLAGAVYGILIECGVLGPVKWG